jgi:wobble nucleotide-excising tRNase
MIKNIYLKNVASFDPEVGVSIKNLTKINVIYGGNGTGKTTIGKFLQNPQREGFEDCSLEWDDGEQEKVIVYNKDFRDNNILKTDKIAGIYTMGDGNTDAIRQIEEKQGLLNVANHQREGVERSLSTKQAEIYTATEELKDNVWNHVSKQNDDFDAALQGAKRKDTFKDRLLNAYRQRPDSPAIYNKEELKQRYDTLFANGTPSPIEPIQLLQGADNLEQLEENPIWAKVVAGKEDVGLGALITRLGMSDWVYRGKSLIEQSGEVCPFCQQKTITPNFRNQLEEYYDETYSNDINSIRQMSQWLNNWMADLERYENHVVNCIDTMPAGIVDGEPLKLAFAGLKNVLSENQVKVANKTAEPSRKLELTKTKDALDTLLHLLNAANTAIDGYNNAILHISDERENLKNQIWQYFVQVGMPYIEAYNTAVDNANRAINALKPQLTAKREECNRLNLEIKEQQGRLTSVRPSVEKINKTLKMFGFFNFELKVYPDDETKYVIVRPDGEAANDTLSEGEETFISFLYFMQLFEGGTERDEVSDKRLLVIDDPVSSLDSNVLYVVSSLLKEMFKRVSRGVDRTITQVILLTHNVYFHKEVTYIDSQTNKDTMHYWIMRKQGRYTTVIPYDTANPIRDSYQLLWDELKNVKNHLDDGTQLWSCVTVQNVMRRIIEWYFRILGMVRRDDELLDGFEDAEQREICRSLLVWANDGSHNVPDDAYLELPFDMIAKYFKVFEKIFEKTQQHEHYAMMMGEGELHEENRD